MKILFATDGSETAHRALEFVKDFPFPRDSEFTLITIVDKDAFTDEGYHGLSPEQRASLRETEDAVREECSELLVREAQHLRDAGWGGRTITRSGHPADEIVRAAEELRADLVVLGSHGLKGLERYLLGSVSSAVLEYAPCSVLVVRGTHEGRAADKPLQILLGYDDSESAKKAVDFCARLPLGEGAKVTALGVMPLVTLFRQDIKQHLSWLWHEKKRAARDALERVVKEVSWTAPDVDYQLREGSDVAQEILRAAKDFDSDLIVLGNKGKSAIEKFLLGTVTKRIARHAPCSVLAVRGSNAGS